MTIKKKPKTVLKDLRVDEVSLVDKGANNKTFYLTKAADPTPASPPESPKMETILKADGSLDTEHPIVKAALEAAASQAAKSESEKVAKAVADARADAEKVAKAAEEKAAAVLAEKEAIEKRLRDEEEAKEISEAIRKCSVEFKNLPAKAEILGPDLRLVRKADAALADRLEDLLKSLNALAEQTLEPKGSARAAEKADSAWGEIQKRAQAVMKAENVSEAVAVDRVLIADKSLYAAYQAEKVRS